MIRARSQSAPLGCVSLRSLLVWLVVGLQFATRSLAPKNARSHSVSQSVSSARLDRAIYIAVCVCVCAVCDRAFHMALYGTHAATFGHICKTVQVFGVMLGHVHLMPYMVSDVSLF